MTLAERLAEMTPAKPRVLVLDLETSPHLAWSFATWQTTINPDMIVQPSRVLCVGWAWADGGPVKLAAEWDAGGHAGMIATAWELLNEASVVVGWNSPGFDEKHIAREFITAGYGPPSPYQSIDLLRTVRQRFKFPSNRLGQIGQSLEVGSKLATEGWPLWQAVLDGDEKARRKFARYCKQDVRLTRDLLHVLAPWVKGLPHAGLWSGDMSACYACGSTDLQPDGLAYAKVNVYVRAHCAACGSWNKVLRNGETRPA